MKFRSARGDLFRDNQEKMLSDETFDSQKDVLTQIPGRFVKQKAHAQLQLKVWTNGDVSPNLRNPDTVPHSNDEANDVDPNDILPTAQSFDETPIPSPTDKLDSNVEDKPHTETEPQLIQQRDNVSTVDPVPESKYNLRNKNRQNPYTFSGKVSEKCLFQS